MKTRSWTLEQLQAGAKSSSSIRQLLIILGLKPAGGNYSQINKFINQYNIDISHFRGKVWNKGMSGRFLPRILLAKILIKNSTYQSHKLKNRLFRSGLKKQSCEKCGWAKRAPDGRIPLELDHINGLHTDNRLENLRILCPNCHSLQLTHRGKNIKSLTK